MSKDIIVFVGHSLSKKIVNTILPEACCHEPIKCGDVIKILRLNPKVLLIIDGYFEYTAAVWHKEILLALERGVYVLGASSIGALRAVELEKFGMKGVGKIFDMYKSGEITGDDEVAIAHDKNFYSINTPLVNVRITLKKAISEGVTTIEVARNIIEEMKNEPYFMRSIYQTLNKMRLNELAGWMKDNYIDQKEIDAKDLLNSFKTLIKDVIKRNKISYSIFFKKILLETITKPFEYNYKWLPKEEILKIKYSKDKKKSKYLTFLYRLILINKNIVFEASISDWSSIVKFRSDFIKFFIIYLNEGAADVEIVFLTYHYQIFLYNLNQLNFTLDVTYLQEFSDFFRIKNGLATTEQTIRWLKNNDLDIKEFNCFIRTMAPFYLMIETLNLGFIDLKIEKLLECLYKDEK